MEYIYLLHYETDGLGIVWQKAYRTQLSARHALSEALGQELISGNDFKSGDEDSVTLRHGIIYIQEIALESE